MPPSKGASAGRSRAPARTLRARGSRGSQALRDRERHILGEVRGDEVRVVDAFCRWLDAEGWTVRREVEFVDVAAVRGDERLYAEAKGRTAAIGTDVDTMYGQLLRRMPDDDVAARYAVVVPTLALKAALRVPAWVRERLRLDVYEVTDEDQVVRR